MSRIAIVTGGAGDIGRAVVARLANDNYRVVILDKSREGGDRLVAAFAQCEVVVDFHCADLSQEAEVQSVFKRILADHGRIDVLVNVAGGSFFRHKCEEFPLDHWRAVIDANLTSTFLCCRAAILALKNQQAGAIVNISSDIAYGGENRSAYAAAKAGILGLTRTLALELAPAGVRVNAVAPGRIETARVRSHYSDAEWNASNDRIPLGHPGAVEDIAEAVAYLAGDAAKHVTGQTLHVNGGRIMT